MFRALLVLSALVAGACDCMAGIGELPVEPVEIGTVPQFFVDDYIVDNRFAIKYKNNAMVRRFHRPVKHEDNPLFTGEVTYPNVVRDSDTGLFRMWYQIYDRTDKLAGGKTKYAIAYAQSKDGLEWERPNLGMFEFTGTRANNVVLQGPDQARASGPQILLSVPEAQRRGYRYLMSYRVGGAGRDVDGIRLIGSHDGINWDTAADALLKHIHSDTLNSIVYDANLDQYVMFCRAKHIYRTFDGEMIDTGASRRVARMAGRELWTEWASNPQNILIPDEQDSQDNYNFFYGMPTHYHAGIYWGFLWVFQMNDPIYTEMVTSRDGVHWERLPARPALIPRGEDGAWDDGMTFGGPHWIEVGDQWWFYYGGFDGPHDSKTRAAGIGLATIRKEGVLSLYGPAAGGGVVVTRSLLWPGGRLVLNVEAPEGEVKVRVSDAMRKVVPGFDYQDCQPFTGDSTAHTVGWNESSIDSLKGEVIRLEIFLRNADLYTFRATGPE